MLYKYISIYSVSNPPWWPPYFSGNGDIFHYDDILLHSRPPAPDTRKEDLATALEEEEGAREEQEEGHDTQGPAHQGPAQGCLPQGAERPRGPAERAGGEAGGGDGW